MNIQFVCVANSLKEGGRQLAGLMLRNSQLALQDGKPQWVFPTMPGFQQGFLTGLVVDLQPLDVLEVEIQRPKGGDFLGGKVVCDPYSIRIRGKFRKDLLLDALGSTGSGIQSTSAGTEARFAQDTVGDPMWIVSAQDCKVIQGVRDPKPKGSRLSLAFRCARGEFELPVKDPFFISAYAVAPELLAQSSAPDLVISMPRRAKTGNIAAVLL